MHCHRPRVHRPCGIRGTPSRHRGPFPFSTSRSFPNPRRCAAEPPPRWSCGTGAQRGLDAESFAPLVDRSAGGIRTTRLIDDLRQRGWNAVAVEGREDLIDAELARGRPVLTLIEDRPGTFHYVVIVASTPGPSCFTIRLARRFA